VPLGMDVGLSSRDFAFDGDPALLPQKVGGAPSPIFGLLWPNGWMDQNGTWHGGGPRSRPHTKCARWGTSSNQTVVCLYRLYRYSTRRPASADRTPRHKFQATGQPLSRMQASDAMTSRLPRYDAKCVRRRCFECGSVPCIQI